MRRLWAALIAALAIAFAAPAIAKEQIDKFDTIVEVARSGDVTVTETIALTSEQAQIRHGILRDLPRFYENNGDRLPFDYHVLSVERDGHPEHYETSHEDNAFRIQIGDEDTLIGAGPHRYVISYRVKNQVRYFDRYDEVYWNATGTFWTFPIASAQATIVLPPGARVMQNSAYTGRLGETGHDYTYTHLGNQYVFATDRPLDAGEGLTVGVAFDKGLIDPPSQADLAEIWWQRNGSLVILVATLVGLFVYLYRAFVRVGRDPVKGPIFPIYEAPAGLSPAATHTVYYRGGLRGNRALIATIMNLAVKGVLAIDAKDKHATTLTAASGAATDAEFAPEDIALVRDIFGGATTKTLGGSYDAGFTAAYAAFRSALSSKYGSKYFRWNVGYTILSVLITIGVVIYAGNTASQWTGWMTLGVLALAALNIAFMYFMPAPTPLGQQVRTEIEGFRLYMDTAEKLQLNAVKVGSAAPPPMTTERYEKFLPYAVALDVEAPWTQYFQRVLPAEAAAYSPVWTNAAWGSNLGNISHSLISNMDSGVSSALPQSSSSSGSGGGGFSGGGGGGGGGSGW